MSWSGILVGLSMVVLMSLPAAAAVEDGTRMVYLFTDEDGENLGPVPTIDVGQRARGELHECPLDVSPGSDDQGCRRIPVRRIEFETERIEGRGRILDIDRRRGFFWLTGIREGRTELIATWEKSRRRSFVSRTQVIVERETEPAPDGVAPSSESLIVERDTDWYTVGQQAIDRAALHEVGLNERPTFTNYRCPGEGAGPDGRAGTSDDSCAPTMARVEGINSLVYPTDPTERFVAAPLSPGSMALQAMTGDGLTSGTSLLVRPPEGPQHRLVADPPGVTADGQEPTDGEREPTTLDLRVCRFDSWRASETDPIGGAAPPLLAVPYAGDCMPPAEDLEILMTVVGDPGITATPLVDGMTQVTTEDDARGALVVRADIEGIGPVDGWVPIAGSSLTTCPEDRVASDIDGSGRVGTADMLILFANWGPTDLAEEPAADLDGDGDIGTADFLQLVAEWGRECAPRDDTLPGQPGDDGSQDRVPVGGPDTRNVILDSLYDRTTDSRLSTEAFGVPLERARTAFDPDDLPQALVDGLTGYDLRYIGGDPVGDAYDCQTREPAPMHPGLDITDTMALWSADGRTLLVSVGTAGDPTEALTSTPSGANRPTFISIDGTRIAVKDEAHPGEVSVGQVDEDDRLIPGTESLVGRADDGFLYALPFPDAVSEPIGIVVVESFNMPSDGAPVSCDMQVLLPFPSTYELAPASAPDAAPPCPASSTTACVNDGRFSIEVVTPDGPATGVTLGIDPTTALFIAPDGAQIVTRVINLCDVSGSQATFTSMDYPYETPGPPPFDIYRSIYRYLLTGDEKTYPIPGYPGSTLDVEAFGCP